MFIISWIDDFENKEFKVMSFPYLKKEESSTINNASVYAFSEYEDSIEKNEFITIYGRTRGNSDAYIEHSEIPEVVTDIFGRGLCLPSDNKMTADVQDVIIDIIHRCFR